MLELGSIHKLIFNLDHERLQLNQTRRGILSAEFSRGQLTFLRFSATLSSEIDAGVTPEILDACPRLPGRIRASFSLTSFDSPITQP